MRAQRLESPATLTELSKLFSLALALTFKVVLLGVVWGVGVTGRVRVEDRIGIGVGVGVGVRFRILIRVGIRVKGYLAGVRSLGEQLQDPSAWQRCDYT